MVRKRKYQQGLSNAYNLQVTPYTTLYRRNDSNYWWADTTLGPLPEQRKRHSTQKTDFHEAKFEAQKLEELFRNGQLPAKVKAVNKTVADAMLGLRASLKLQARFRGKPRYLRSDENALERLAPYWTKTALRALNDQHLEQWKVWRSQQPNRQGKTKRFGKVSELSEDKLKQRKLVSIKTIEKEYSFIRAAVEWAYLNGWLTARLNLKLSFEGRSDNDEDTPRAMPNDTETAQLEAFLKKILDDPKSSYRHMLSATWIATLLYGGLRPTNETEDMRWSDIGWNGSFVTIFVSKGKNGARQAQAWPELKPFFDRLRKLQEDIMGEVEGSHHIWKLETGAKVNNFTRQFDAAVELAGIMRTDLVPYSLRHRYLTDALRKGVPSLQLALNAGTSEDMLRRHYTHLNDKDITEALMKAKR